MTREFRTGGPFSEGPNGERAVTTQCPKCKATIGRVLRSEPFEWRCPHCKMLVARFDGTQLAVFARETKIVK